MNNLFYQGASPSPDQNKVSPPKPPLHKAKTTAPGPDDSSLNPFNMTAGAQKSIPVLIQMISKVNFDISLPDRDHIQMNKLYQILSGELGMDISVGELKSLNKYMINKKLEGQ